MKHAFILIGLWLCVTACQNQFPKPIETDQTTSSDSLRKVNLAAVEGFFQSLETAQFEKLKELFAQTGRQVNPYVPAGFPSSFDGVDAIYKQYSSLPQTFGQMRFPRTIHTTEDPGFFFVEFKGEIEIKAGGYYKNDYLGTFKVENGRILVYTEYFNPLVMAKAFNIPLK
jgi:uncharacterized protein